MSTLQHKSITMNQPIELEIARVHSYPFVLSNWIKKCPNPRSRDSIIWKKKKRSNISNPKIENQSWRANEVRKLTCNWTFKRSGPELQEGKNPNTHKENSSLLAKNDTIWIFLTRTSNNGCPFLSLGLTITVLDMKDHRMGMRRERRRRTRREWKIRL